MQAGFFSFVLMHAWIGHRSSFEPCRKFRYDESQLEFFIQTADSIVVKKSELDAYKKAEHMDPNQAGS